MPASHHPAGATTVPLCGMRRAFPDAALFERIDKFGLKYSLSEKYAPRAYSQLVRSSPVWRIMSRWIWSDDFITGVLNALRIRNIDLGFKAARLPF